MKRASPWIALFALGSPPLAAQGTDIRATLQLADAVAKVKIVEGYDVEVLRVFGDGDATLVGQRITLEPVPWNGMTGLPVRTCLSVTNMPGQPAGTHWLVALQRHGDGDHVVYRQPIGDGLLGTRVPATHAEPNDNPAAAILAELLAALDDPDAAIRESVMKALRRWDGEFMKNPGTTLWRDDKIAARLLALADDPAEQVRWVLAWMIPEQAGEAGEAVLLRLLFDDARLR